MYVYICRESVLTLIDVIHGYTSMIRERESCEYVWESIIHICDMTHSFTWVFVTHAFFCVTWWFICAFIFVAWYIDHRIHVCDRTRSHTYVTESEMTQIVYYVYTCTFNSRFCIMYLYLCICKEKENVHNTFFVFLCEYVHTHVNLHRDGICGITHSSIRIFVTHAFSCVTWWFMYAFIFIVWYIYQLILLRDRTLSYMRHWII